jgi:replicative DNA helicase
MTTKGSNKERRQDRSTGGSYSQDRTMPHNLEAERALLGSILLDNSLLDATIDGGVDLDDFYGQAHGIVYQRMIDMAEKRRTIDLVTLSEVLNGDGLLEKAGGDAYLAALTDGVPIGTTSGFSEYVRIVKEKSTLRKIIVESNNTIARCFEGGEESGDILSLTQQRFYDLDAVQVEPGFATVREIVKSSFGKFDALFERGQKVTGIETGITDLDALTSGLHPGELIVVAARPGQGKTGLVLQMAAHNSLRKGVSCGMFSLEMEKEQLVMRLLCAEARIDGHKLRTGFTNRDDWNRMTPVLGRISDAPLYIDDTPALSIQKIRSKARRLKAEKDVSLLIVDYLQLISSRAENRQQEVSHVSRSLKALAKELGIPVVAVSALSRESDKRVGGIPQLSDLRESGSIEFDADVVVFIYGHKRREEDEDDLPEGALRKTLLIGKQRNGPTGAVPVVFLKTYAKFENQARKSMYD